MQIRCLIAVSSASQVRWILLNPASKNNAITINDVCSEMLYQTWFSVGLLWQTRVLKGMHSPNPVSPMQEALDLFYSFKTLLD
jgi:hypothetical protein